MEENMFLRGQRNKNSFDLQRISILINAAKLEQLPVELLKEETDVDDVVNYAALSIIRQIIKECHGDVYKSEEINLNTSTKILKFDWFDSLQLLAKIEIRLEKLSDSLFHDGMEHETFDMAKVVSDLKNNLYAHC